MEQFDFEYEFEEDILDFLFNNYDFQNEEDYADAMRESVDNYVSKNDDKHRDLVDGYGVFEAIKLYEQTYGRYEVLDKVSENYTLLTLIIIYEKMRDKYGFETIMAMKSLFD